MHSKQRLQNLLSRTVLRAATVTLAMAMVFALTVALSQATQGQTYTVIHTFTGGADGASPQSGLTIDAAGNLYGTAIGGGGGGYGAVFKLHHVNSGWIFTPLYAFTGSNDGAEPSSRVIFGPGGSLYGTTTAGGGGPCSGINYSPGCGTVFNLRPSATACKTALCPWVENVLYRFTGGSDGAYPLGDLTFDQAGSIYNTTYLGGSYGFGVTYELMPSNGGWAQSVIYSFTGGADGATPAGGVIFDRSGNLYGTSSGGYTNGYGTVFQLTPSGSSGWIYNVIYTFQNGSDGAYPSAGLILDGSGNLYGTTSINGPDNGGTVFELTPSHGGWMFIGIHRFTGCDLICLTDSLVMDRAGNLYGTTFGAGAYGFGNVFKLTPLNDNWIYSSLHDFTGGSDGLSPEGGVALDANGNLYGTTTNGGAYNDGVVWEIRP